MDIEQATIEMNAMSFPAVDEGDVAYHEGFRFVYTDGIWVASEG